MNAVLASLHSSPDGLTIAEAQRRAAASGPNVVAHGKAGPLRVFASQLANPLLVLLAVTAVISLVLGQSADAIIILGIVAISVGLGFFNRRLAGAKVRRRPPITTHGPLCRHASARAACGTRRRRFSACRPWKTMQALPQHEIAANSPFCAIMIVGAKYAPAR